MGAQSTELGREGKRAVDQPCPIEGLDTEPVTREPEPPFAAVPEGDGVHAVALAEGIEHPPSRNGLKNDFGIGMAAPTERRTSQFDLAAELCRVVEFTIVNHDP